MQKHTLSTERKLWLRKIWFNGLQWSSWDGLGHIRLLWLEGGWIWWHSLVSLKSDGSSWRAGKGCGKSCDAFSWTNSLELSSSVPRVLIRVSLTILPKDSSSLNSWFNEIIVIHEETTMWHVNVFFLTCKHYVLVILTSLKEPETMWKGAKLTKWCWGYRF